jgi:hypothetical protein
MRQFVRCLLLIVGTLSVAGCVKPGDFCDTAKPLRPSNAATVDYLYDNGEETFADDVLSHNLYGEKQCKWRP